MKKYFDFHLDLIKRACLEDRVNFNFLVSSLAVAGLSYIIWKEKLSAGSANFYWRLPFSPLTYFIIILVINLLLSLNTFDNEKEVSHLLLGATTLISLLVFILFMFYLTNS